MGSEGARELSFEPHRKDKPDLSPTKSSRPSHLRLCFFFGVSVPGDQAAYRWDYGLGGLNSIIIRDTFSGYPLT